VQCQRSDGTIVNDSYCSGSKPSTSWACGDNGFNCNSHLNNSSDMGVTIRTNTVNPIVGEYIDVTVESAHQNIKFQPIMKCDNNSCWS
jgi:hypothetical protein